MDEDINHAAPNQQKRGFILRPIIDPGKGLEPLEDSRLTTAGMKSARDALKKLIKKVEAKRMQYTTPTTIIIQGPISIYGDEDGHTITIPAGTVIEVNRIKMTTEFIEDATNCPPSEFLFGFKRLEDPSTIEVTRVSTAEAAAKYLLENTPTDVEIPRATNHLLTKP